MRDGEAKRGYKNDENARKGEANKNAKTRKGGKTRRGEE